MQDSAEARLVTADELFWMPDGRCRRELVRGELREYPCRGALEGMILAQLTVALGNHAKRRRLGEVYAGGTGFHVSSDPDTVLAPAAAFVRDARLTRLEDEDRYFPGAPDLAVECVSPDASESDLDEKVFDWLAAGCRMVLVVHPKLRTVTVHRSQGNVVRLTENDVLDGGGVVPGWKLPLREVFA